VNGLSTLSKKINNRKRRRYRLTKTAYGVIAVLLGILLFCIFGADRNPDGMEDPFYPRKYSDLVEAAAEKYDLDENFIYAIIKTESGFDTMAVSELNAVGLMQVTEETFDWLSFKMENEGTYVHEDLADPEIGIEYGCYLLHYLMENFDGEMSTVIAAYHAGINITESWLEDETYSSDGSTLHTIPYEDTDHYVGKVLGNYEHYREIYG